MTNVPDIRSHNFGKIVNKRHFVHRFVTWILSEKQEVNHTFFAVLLVVFTAVPDWSFHKVGGEPKKIDVLSSAAVEYVSHIFYAILTTYPFQHDRSFPDFWAWPKL